MDDRLDLSSTLRPGLDLLANEIIIALKKRTRFRQNPEIYRPGLVLGHPEVALLDFELERTERFHAALGRYAYTRIDSYSDVGDVPLIIRRVPPPSPTNPYPTGMAPGMRARYVDWVRACCTPGSDSDTWGESVSADVAVLMGLAERITMGKSVAEAKYQQNPAAYRRTGGDPERIRDLLVHAPRESEVLARARQLARLYEFDEAQALELFRWIIQTTVAVEIRYLQRRLADEGCSTGSG